MRNNYFTSRCRQAQVGLGLMLFLLIRFKRSYSFHPAKLHYCLRKRHRRLAPASYMYLQREVMLTTTATRLGFHRTKRQVRLRPRADRAKSCESERALHCTGAVPARRQVASSGQKNKKISATLLFLLREIPTYTGL